MKEASFILTLLLESGQMQKVILPEILRSKKRNSPFYYPGTLWDVKFSGNQKEYMVPRELYLVFSPVGIQPDYEELLLFQESLKFTKFLLPGSNYRSVYYLLKELIFSWQKVDHIKGNILISRFYLGMLQELGYFSIQNICHICHKTLDDRSEAMKRKSQNQKIILYHLGKGEVCGYCLNSESKEEILIRIDQRLLYWHDSSENNSNFSMNGATPIDSKSLKKMRENILKYLETF